MRVKILTLFLETKVILLLLLLFSRIFYLPMNHVINKNIKLNIYLLLTISKCPFQIEIIFLIHDASRVLDNNYEMRAQTFTN